MKEQNVKYYGYVQFHQIIGPHVMCFNYFNEKYVVWFQPYRNPNGDVQHLPLRCPKLAEGAVPNTFDDMPKYYCVKTMCHEN